MLYKSNKKSFISINPVESKLYFIFTELSNQKHMVLSNQKHTIYIVDLLFSW